MTSLVLNMLAHRSALSIARAIDSVRPYISAWCIGISECDAWQESAVRSAVGDLPGAFVDVGPMWPQGFASMRNQVFDASRHMADYMLWLDADDTIDAPVPLASELWCDCYAMQFVDPSGVTFDRVQVVRCASDLRWSHRAHEGFFVNDGRPMGYLKNWRYMYTHNPKSREALEMGVALSMLDVQENPGDMSVLFGLAQNQLYLNDFDSVQRIMGLLERDQPKQWEILQRMFFTHLERQGLAREAIAPAIPRGPENRMLPNW